MPDDSRVALASIEILKAEPTGLRKGDLLGRVKKSLNSSGKDVEDEFWTWTSSLRGRSDAPVIPMEKPKTGYYLHIKFRVSEIGETGQKKSEDKKRPIAKEAIDDDEGSPQGKKAIERNEAKFYPRFVEYLLQNKGDGPIKCTNAAIVGGSTKGKKWANPDVVGVYKPSTTFAAFQPEVIFVEIKYDSGRDAILTGFAQAIAYVQFCNRSYLVIPSEVEHDLFERIHELCAIYDLGLVKFDRSSSANPDWQLVRDGGWFNPGVHFITSKLRELGPDVLGKLGFST